MLFLEKNNKKGAVVFFCGCLLFAIPLLIRASFPVKLMACAALICAAAVSTSYFFSGLAAAVTILSLMAVLWISFGLMQRLSALLPFSYQWFRFFSLVLPVASIPLLFKVYNVLFKHTQKNIDKNTPKGELAAYFVPEKKKPGACYEQITEYKKAAEQQSKPYSLTNAPKLMRVFRCVFGGAFFLSGYFLLVLFSMKNVTLGDIAHLVARSAAMMIGGVCLIRSGFLRGMTTAAVSIAVVVAGFLDYRLLDCLRGRSHILYGIVVFLTAWLIIAIVCIIRYYKICKKITSVCIYSKNGCLKGTDMDLNELLPIQNYSKFVTVSYSIAAGSDKVFRLIRTVQRFACSKKIIFCGFEQTNEDRIHFYFYARTEWKQHSSILRHLTWELRVEKAKIQNVSCEDDPDWSQYQTVVYPDPQTLLNMEADNMANMLQRVDIDLSVPLRFGFTLIFLEKNDAVSCADDMTEAGYQVDRIQDNTATVKEQDIKEKFSFSINVSRINQPGSEHLKLLTADVRQRTERFSGELYEWGLVNENSKDVTESRANWHAVS